MSAERDERSAFERRLSTWVIAHKAGADSPADVVGSLVGTAAAEHVFAGHTREEFMRICEAAFDGASAPSDVGDGH